MIRLALALCLAALAAAPAHADPSHGLIENHTGLPLTLPLQVKTTPGRDIYLVMRNAETTKIAVTAYIEGGRFFRLLMPPGTYTLHAAIGSDWQGTETLFGDETEFYTLPEALEFRAGATRKTGHLVDLTGRSTRVAARTRDIALCQYLGLPIRRDALPQRSTGPTSIAPEIPYDLPLPPGPRDPALDGSPELGQEFGNTVPDIPLAQRLGQGAPAGIARNPAPVESRRLRQRLCDPA